MNKQRNKKINFILFFIGLSLILFPFIIKIISSFEQTTVINSYKSEISNMSQIEKEFLEEEAKSFNARLFQDTSSEISLSQENISTLHLSNQNIIAYITIPNINLELPIYEGCDDNVLSLGIGHLPNSSLPIGGNNTHCVLVGHTGLAKATIFDNLDKLSIGDCFSITYLDNILNYEVCQIKIVDPNYTNDLIIQENEDLVTLVTCTPKFINTHRLLVTGKRVSLEEQMPNYNEVTKEANKSTSVNYYTTLLFINIIITLLVLIFIYFSIRRYLRINKR